MLFENSGAYCDFNQIENYNPTFDETHLLDLYFVCVYQCHVLHFTRKHHKNQYADELQESNERTQHVYPTNKWFSYCRKFLFIFRQYDVVDFITVIRCDILSLVNSTFSL